MFGHDEKKQDKDEKLEQWRAAAQAEFKRLTGLPVGQLASEVMVKGFGPGGPGADDDAITLGQANINSGPTAEDISYAFVPQSGVRFPSPEDLKLRERISRLIAEGLQELEHASLVRCQMHTSMGYLDWAATRRGRAALEGDEIQSILQAAGT